MNEIPDKAKCVRHASGSSDPWTKLMALAAMVEIDETHGTLTLKTESLRSRSDRMDGSSFRA